MGVWEFLPCTVRHINAFFRTIYALVRSGLEEAFQKTLGGSLACLA